MGVIAAGSGTVSGALIAGIANDPSSPDLLVALDPVTRAIVWKAASPRGLRPASSDGAVLAGGNADGDSTAVWAVRGDSGAPLWRRALEVKGWLSRLATPGDGCAYAIVEEGFPAGPLDHLACVVSALDVGTGELRWSYRVPAAKEHEPCGAEADADVVVLAAPDGALHVLDAVTGALRVRVPVPALHYAYEGFGMLVRSPVAYVLTGSDDDLSGGGPRRALVAIDLDAGRTRWKHPAPVSSGEPAVADEERIYVQVDGGELRAIALFDGTLQWSWYAGFYDPAAMLVPPEAPRWLIVAGESGNDGTMGFDLRTPLRKSLVRTRIAGRLVPAREAFDPSGIAVHVGDQVVRTDALGRFSADVRGEGDALVEARVSSVRPRTPIPDNPEPCTASSAERVRLDGRTHADMRLTVEFGECAEGD